MGVFIIAEAGVNHNGDFELAKQLIKVASDAGCDAVKFQTFKAKDMISASAKKCDYQIENTGTKESQVEMVAKLELKYEHHTALIDYCKENKIMFMSSPFENESIDFLNHLGLQIFKIPSGEVTNLPYLEKINSLKKEVILSTGMCEMHEIKKALEILCDSKKITVLHCNTDYPTKFGDVNLKAMLDIKNSLNVHVGYSDHTLGIEVPIAAVALGAELIEKHITLDKNMEGPDHAASLEPDELKAMVRAIRNIELALGTGVKKPSLSELKNMQNVRRSIVARIDIKKGDLFSNQNLTVKRPGTGISPMLWHEIIGKNAKSDYLSDENIFQGELE